MISPVSGRPMPSIPAKPIPAPNPPRNPALPFFKPFFWRSLVRTRSSLTSAGSGLSVCMTLIRAFMTGSCAALSSLFFIILRFAPDEQSFECHDVRYSGMFQLISPPPSTDTAQGEAEKIVGVLLRRGRARQLQMVKANCCTCDENLLLSSTHSLQEGNEGHEAFIVGGLAELLHQGLGPLLGQLLSEVGQQTEQLVAQHSVVVIFVIELQDLNKVMEASLVLGVLAGLVHGEHLGLGDHLLALLGGASDLGDGLEGRVEVGGADEVADVESIDLAVSLEVVDIEGEIDGVNFLLLETEFSHC